MKLEWGKEKYTVCCVRNERNGLGWFKPGVWKSRGVKRGFVKGRCPLCREEEDATHIYIIIMFGNDEAEGTFFVWQRA
jgi:hypothetical protein